jgi:predicted AAA+ superfamily ATPase
MYRDQLIWLKQWAERKTHKPLVIRGARQVGKSTLVSLFAESQGLDLVLLNFERNPEYTDIFAQPDPVKIIKTLSLLLGREVEPGKSLLFLDEVQVKPEILGTLRYFYEELSSLHVIAAGSLLDFEMVSPAFSMPVGRISYLHMGPMNFTEFLRAMGDAKLADFVSAWQVGEEIPEAVHHKLMLRLRQNMAVGGMPEAVAAFAEAGSYKLCEEVKQDLLGTFSDDFAKYAKQNDYDLIRQAFRKAPLILGRKVKYSEISPDKRSVDVARVLNQLTLARVISKVLRSAANGLPLSAEENDKFFKLLFLDTGLVSTLLNLSYQALQSEDLLQVNSGALAEQWVGQALLHSLDPHEQPYLHYWAREERSSSAEVDYVIAGQGKVIPVEVKAGKSGSLKSMHVFLKEKSSDFAVRFNADRPSLMNASHQLSDGLLKEYQLLSLPLYMAGECRRLLLSKTS